MLANLSPLLTLLSVTIAVASSLAALVALATARAAQRQADQLQQNLVNMEQQLIVATQGSIGMGKRVLALEQNLKALTDNQDLSGSDSLAYTQAMRMFEQGADVETVASSCELSSSEVNLMALLREQLANNKTQSA